MPEARVSYAVRVTNRWKSTDVAIYVDREVRKLVNPDVQQVVTAISNAPGVSYVSPGSVY